MKASMMIGDAVIRYPQPQRAPRGGTADELRSLASICDRRHVVFGTDELPDSGRLGQVLIDDGLSRGAIITTFASQ